LLATIQPGHQRNIIPLISAVTGRQQENQARPNPGTGQPVDAGSNSDAGYGARAPAIDDRQYTVFCGPGRMTYENHALKEKAMIDILVLVVLLRYTGENIALFSGGLFTGATIYIGPSAKARPSDAARQTPTCSLLFLHRPSLGLGHL
jgi:hypothetical protein